VAELRSVEAYLEGKDSDLVALFRRFEKMVQSCGPSVVAPRRTVVYWKRNRIFAGAYIERRRLELILDLLREVEHPCLIAAFPTTKKVITNRLRIAEPDQLDDAVAAFVAEAYAEVGPGTRSISAA
jgi:hypothetical protein